MLKLAKCGTGTHYDGAMRPMGLRHRNTNIGSPVLLGWTHTYDRAGNKLTQDTLHGSKDDLEYEYDSTYRLIGFERPDAWSDQVEEHTWDLDGLGNWSSNQRTIDGTPLSAETWLDTSFNEYYRIGVTLHSHDDHGNLTNDGTLGYEWGEMNRLCEVNDTTGTVDGADARHFYLQNVIYHVAGLTDADGHLVEVSFSGWDDRARPEWPLQPRGKSIINLNEIGAIFRGALLP